MKKRCLVFFVLLLLSINNISLAADRPKAFNIRPLSQDLRKELTTFGLWNSDCPVSLDDLRVISVSYYDLLGHLHYDGRIIVHKSIANSTLRLFKTIYLHHFPFSAIDTLVKYHGNPQQAEENNVSYGFICKKEGTNFLPESYGKVLTINPRLNPEASIIANTSDHQVKIQPNTGIFAINRSLKLKGMTESIEKILNKYGFVRLHLPKEQIGWKKFILQPNGIEKKINTSDQNFYLTSPTKNSTSPVFSAQPLPQEIKEKLRELKLWQPGCPVALERLSLLTISYYDFEGKVQTGNLIILDAAAPYLLNAFKTFFSRQFPLEKLMIYSATDDKEQTMAFNCRKITGGENYSLHSYGLTIDINVARNPYLGAYKKNSQGQYIGMFLPSEMSSLSYLNRDDKRLGMNEDIVKIMAQNGFIQWGGNWQDRVDYMHFQVPKNIAENIVYLNTDSAKEFLALIIKYPNAAKKMSSDQRWQYLYEFSPKKYIRLLKKYFPLLESKEESAVINRIYMEWDSKD